MTIVANGQQAPQAIPCCLRHSVGRIIHWTLGTFRGFGENRTAGGLALTRPANRQKHHAHGDDTGAQHTEMFGDAAGDIDDAAPVLAVHTVINLNHSTTPVVGTQHGDPRTEREAVAGGSKAAGIETLAGGRSPTGEAVAIETGIAVQTREIGVKNSGRAETGSRWKNLD